MNTHIRKFLIVFLVLVIGVIGCTPLTTPLSPTSTSTPPTPTSTPPLPPVCQSLATQDPSPELNPKDVVSGMVLALNGGDVATAMSYFAENARVFVFGVPPNSFQFMLGKEEICRFLVGYTNNNVEWELTNLFSINAFGGSDVISNSNIGFDDYRELGIASLQFNEKFLVHDGKITNYEAWLEKSSLAQLREVLPEITFTNPGTSSEIPGSEVTMIFSNHTCTYEGPAAWQSGYIDFTIKVLDHKDVKNALLIINLDDGFDGLDLAVSLIGETPPWLKRSLIFDSDYYDTSTKHKLVSAEQLSDSTEGGERYLVCVGGDRGWVIGLFGPFEVIP